MTFEFFNKMKQQKDIFLQNQRNFLRSKIDIKPLNYSLVFSFLPFYLGVLQFIFNKYSFEKTNIFFEKNLPAISLPTQTIHWETFMYFRTNPQNKNFLTNIGTKIVLSKNDINIETKNSNDFPFVVSNNLKGYKIFPQSNTIESNFQSLQLLEKNENFILRVYQNIDEMPRKLEGNLYSSFQAYSQNRTDPKHTKYAHQAMLASKFERSEFLNRIFKSLEFADNIVVTPQKRSQQKTKQIQISNFSIPSEQLIGYQLAPELEIKKNAGELASSLDQQYKKFFKNQDTLYLEIKKLFLNNTGLPLISKKRFLRDSSNVVLMTNENSDQIFKVISEIDKLLLPNPLKANRLMSGYQYPDMELKEIFTFIAQKHSRKTSNLKIVLPPTYLFAQNAHFSPPTVPSYRIESTQVVLEVEDGNQPRTFYKGPSLLLNKQIGFDWNLNSDSLYFWIEDLLGEANPVKTNFKNFFGVLESPEYLLSVSNQNRSFRNYILDNLILLKNGLLINPLTSYLPFTRSFFVPQITPKEWEYYITKAGQITDSKAIHYNTIVLPVLETRMITPQNPTIQFGYKNLSDFEFIGRIPSIFNISNSTTRFYNQSSFRLMEPSLTNSNSISYKKLQSIFSRNSNQYFSDIWEPLTFNSWLITAQLGFAFLGFTTLKALADNYGQELLVYLLDLVAVLGFVDADIKQEIEILMGKREKGFRIIEKVKQNFQNIGGIQKLLPEVVEIVWFLRNSGRSFSLSKTIPRGILLTGPPGTGKTLLVQAIAGEAQVPVFALSGSSLFEPGESGALKLEILFDEARKSAPCIVFIDEVDTLAQKRVQVLQNPMGADEILESLSSEEMGTSTFSEFDFTNKKPKSNDEFTQLLFAQQDVHKEKLRILMQFLVELDGIKRREGVIVIAATNRPEMLDPAVLRPGRFDRILSLPLPSADKRREILNLYGQNLGFDKTVSMDYLINRTSGYSAADLAGLMNQSTLNAILNNTQHTIQTIEYGIDRITTIGLENSQKDKNNKFLSTQIAYYQAGKILISYLLEHHPPNLVTHLWPRRANARALQINENLQKYLFRFARRRELEHRLIGCYAGKAAEILFLQSVNSDNSNLSDLGIEEAQFAQNLVEYMIEKWVLYGKTHITAATLKILNNFNEKEYRYDLEKLAFFEIQAEELELSLIETQEDFGGEEVEEEDWLTQHQAQMYFPTASWQYQISYEFELSTRTFSDWYRLYLPDPLQKERNLEWIPPDRWYHGNNVNEKLTSSITWNELSKIHIDYEAHSLILQSFNKALSLLNQHREILDKLAYELLSNEILREPEIRFILKSYNLNYIHLETEHKLVKKTNQSVQSVVSTDWGINSRKSRSRYVHL